MRLPGSTKSPSTSGSGTTVNAIVVKYDTNGKQIWTKTAPLTPGDSNSAFSIHLDAAENVYFLVDDIFNSQIHDCFIVKFNLERNRSEVFRQHPARLGRRISMPAIHAMGDGYDVYISKFSVCQ